jgi:hypothetical protein
LDNRPAIHLVRHARVNYRHPERWINAAGVMRFEDGYNAAPIHDDSHPPAELIDVAAMADVLAASDMSRAIASAQRLAPGRQPDVSPLLREITLQPPAWIRIPLPIVAWDLFSHAQVSSYLWRLADHEFVRRGEQATDWLLQRATGAAQVVAITHGGFRRILDHRLVARGWKRAVGVRTYENWSVWSYTR